MPLTIARHVYAGSWPTPATLQTAREAAAPRAVVRPTTGPSNTHERRHATARFSLDDRYNRVSGEILLDGMQALVRVMLDLRGSTRAAAMTRACS